jgi:hypothetical protein
MTGKRIPKQGEVWTWNGRPRTVWVVDGDGVAVECGDGVRFIVTIDYFTTHYTPPEPTVKDSANIHVDPDNGIDWSIGKPTHRIEVLTDGTVRLVEVDG